jgi:ribose 5-phosphate isomerase A
LTTAPPPAPPASPDLKQVAGRAAADRIAAGTVVGLGTGSTAVWAVRRLGERVRGDGLAVVAVATSRATEDLARAETIPLATLDDVAGIDVTIDGADQVDPAFCLIKGGGGALLREKVVARRTRQLVIIVDPSKLVDRLGGPFPLPVEVVPFARRPVVEQIARLGGEPVLRTRDGQPFVTDNGNWIVDVRFAAGIARPAELERALKGITGVVESGLFIDLVHTLIVGRDGGAEVVPVRA